MELQNLEISKCYESPTNPRGAKFDRAELGELVASIKEKGVLMPILVRRQSDKYEVVAGNRRLRAAKEAGLQWIPARVEDMTDVEAREAQIVENLQRADVHPLEEGEAYRKLIEHSGYDVAAVAAKVGKSESYVRDRLVLTNLSKTGQAAFRDGRMTAGHAALIARLDGPLQKEAVEYVTDEWQTPTTAELREWIQRRQLEASMKEPPWKGDEEMQAALGGCEECKGKGGDLFGKKAADACTNPKCYANRLAAHVAIKLRDNPSLLELSGNWSSDDKTLPTRGSYHQIGSKKDRCKHAETGIIVEGEGIGHVIDFCRTPDCEKHWSHSQPSGHYAPTAEEKAARKKAREAEAKKREKDAKAVADGLAKVSWPFAEKHLDALFALALKNASDDVKQGVCKRREWEAPKRKDWHGRNYSGVISAAAREMKPKEKAGLVFELLLPSYSPHFNEGRASVFKTL